MKSYSKITAKIEIEQEKQADVIAKENKKVNQNIDLTLAPTEKNNHEETVKKVGREKYEK
ncbi:hypothetical protein QUF83_27060 [Bacillus cereus]|uniref:hypothetical protein n=1 Tax=Bacillus cereus TaxID=1396 RepID=UPI0025A08DD1|nr:hypothetical protein [Bacillus cereus]MDM5239651.1 hypothetical protein [Bacillus cereus]